MKEQDAEILGSHKDEAEALCCE